MKKFSFIAMAALALAGMTSCDEYTLPNPPAQSNPEEAVFNASDLTVEDLTGGTINLPAKVEANVAQPVLKYTVANLPADRMVKFTLEISDTEDFAKTAQVGTTAGEDGTVTVSPYELETAYAANFSRSLEPTTLHIRLAAFIANAAGTENVRVGGPDTWFMTGSVAFTPYLIGHIVETGYYLVGSFNDWQISAAIPFTQLNAGDPYDNPDFYINVQVSAAEAEAGYSWKVIPASAYEAGNWDGAYGAVASSEDGKTGTLVESPEAETNAGTITEAGSYQISVNMYNLTYKVGLAYDYLWINARGYYPQFDKMLRMFTDDYVNYKGVMRVNHTFSLYCQDNAGEGAVAYGADADVEASTDKGTTKGKMALCTDLTKLRTMEVPGYAFYLLKANLQTLDWEATEITSISIVGAFNEWNTADENATMTPDRYWTKFTINNVALTAGEFKFCANHDWAISFGGALDNIVENGGNINVEEAGTYDILLDFTTIPYSATLTRK